MTTINNCTITARYKMSNGVSLIIGKHRQTGTYYIYAGGSLVTSYFSRNRAIDHCKSMLLERN